LKPHHSFAYTLHIYNYNATLLTVRFNPQRAILRE